MNTPDQSLAENVAASAKPLKVAIQGVAGCFHDAAAREYFADRDVSPIECNTFAEMFEVLDADASSLGIMAIENTIAGALLQNHELLRRSNLRIIGEHKKRISHSLCAMPGQSLSDITEVHSHPMALMQCGHFLHAHPTMRAIEAFDTAGAAANIARDGLMRHAAICPELAAKLYGLEVLENGIETNKRNFTRFLVLADPLLAAEIGPKESEVDKSSIAFTLPHTQGALSKVLTIFTFYDINLSKIQSMPIVGREWEYRFYVDLTFDSVVRYHQAIDAVRPLISDLRLLGEYVGK